MISHSTSYGTGLANIAAEAGVESFDDIVESSFRGFKKVSSQVKVQKIHINADSFTKLFSTFSIFGVACTCERYILIFRHNELLQENFRVMVNDLYCKCMQ